jgi:methionyl-tRNA formyltransferase
MRLVVFAYQQVGFVCLEELLEQGAEVAAVVTYADDPGENVWWDSVAELARRHGIPVLLPEDVNAPAFVATLRDLRPDMIFSFYFRDLLCDEILAIPPRGGLNLHGSLLPHYRGRAPVNWALVNGETETGVTLHYMVRRADAGDVVAQRRVPIAFEDTAHTLYGKMVVAARETLREAWPLLREGRAPRTPQDLARGSYVGRRRPEDGRIDWSWPALRCYNLIRAVTHPYPGAFTYLEGHKLFIWWATPAPEREGRPAQPDVAPGTLLVSPDEVAVTTGAGLLLLRRIQFEREEERDATALVGDGRLRPGQHFDTGVTA